MTSRMRIGDREAILPDREHPDAVNIDHPAVQRLLKKLAEEVEELRKRKRKYVQNRLCKLEQVYDEKIRRNASA